MKLIKLTQGQFAVVDDEDFDWLSRWKWYAQWNAKLKRFYARRTEYPAIGTPYAVWMHRQILGLERGDKKKADHINRLSTLDNRRDNLRAATNSQNLMNQGIRSDNKTGFKGVTRFGAKWQASIMAQGKWKYLGLFSTPEEASDAYYRAAKELHGEFARLA